jgi:hypothetical protein
VFRRPAKLACARLSLRPKLLSALFGSPPDFVGFGSGSALEIISRRLDVVPG